MTTIWSGADAAHAMEAASPGPMPGRIRGISIDTRTIRRDELFFAIRGEARDGHDFVGMALEKGAAGAVVAAGREAEFAGKGPLLVVPDVLKALEQLGGAARARSRAAVVAVTGSVGKTSTKEQLRQVFGAQGVTHASAASYNNHWGVPLTLARMPREARFGVFEIGMSNPFEILALTAMVRPHAAIVTTVEPVHLAQFNALEGIADAKGEIFQGLLPGGTAILNRDNAHFARLKAHAAASPAGRIITFGEHEEADVRLVRIAMTADVSAIEANVCGRSVTYRVGTPGRHMALNSLAVLAAVQALGGDLALAAIALGQFEAVSGRGQRSELATPDGAFMLLDESYNANPASVRASLALLGQMSVGFRGRRIAVLGDMLELGPGGPQMHKALAAAIDEHQTDLVFACGPLMKNLWDALPMASRGAYAGTSAELEDSVLSAVRAGDAVMVKGSLGSRMGPIVTALKKRYSAAVSS
jgi:UDP-N-acetylmuramoyl-tripeptide--D-alanyl-D-alanine ligase